MTGEVLLTSVLNVVGYTAVFLTTVWLLAEFERHQIGPVPAAALALFSIWVLITVWYVATVYWLDGYSQHGQPPWLVATSGMAENIQSEVIQVWAAALVFKHLLWPGSPESQ
jgi:hypothetical protein